VTVPAIIATLSGRMVTNDYPQITLDLSTEWVEHHRAGTPDLYPVAQRPEIDALMLEVYTDLNNGVHRAGFASSQEAYQTGYDGCSGAWTHSRIALRARAQAAPTWTKHGLQRSVFATRTSSSTRPSSDGTSPPCWTSS